MVGRKYLWKWAKGGGLKKLVLPGLKLALWLPNSLAFEISPSNISRALWMLYTSCFKQNHLEGFASLTYMENSFNLLISVAGVKI